MTEMSFFRWGPKPTVAEQRRQAEQRLAKLSKTGGGLSAVVIEGRKIAASFWGKAWCENLERYSDYANRLPRGRSYVRNSCVIDLQIGRGEISALVSGSSLYEIRITVAPLEDKTWNGICRDCSSSIDSMVELLQGRLSKAVMDRVCRPGDGLFPVPKSIELSCSCPDGAYMCKHVAATLYGVGARLDSRPELLFVLRGVDQQELIARASAAPIAAVGKKPTKSGKVLGDADLSTLFGLNIEAPPSPADKEAKAAIKTRPRHGSGRHRGKNDPKRADRNAPPQPKRTVRKAKQARSRTPGYSASAADAPKHSSRKRTAKSALAT
jgi:uncharacterized Zn finger protein